MTLETERSPKWGATVKLVIGLTLVAILAGIFIYYRSIISLLILAFIITYLVQPVVKFLSDKTSMSWRLTSTLVFLLILILLLASLTGAGVVIVQQASGLIRVVERFTNDLPNLAAEVTLFLEQYGLPEVIDLNNIANQILNTLQPIVGQAGSLVGSIATGAATGIGRMIFVLLVAYFVSAESQRVDALTLERIPNYDYDIRRMTRQLKGVWNSFFRGQMIIFMMVFVVYMIAFTILGVRYSYALALLAGLAVFVPYVGLWTTNIVLVLVTFFQPTNYFGMLPWQFTALSLAVALVLNFIFDNYISPRFLGRTLDIHPAAVLVAALVMATLLGLVGIFLAAPVVATLKAVGLYVYRKMLDLDPWPEPEEEPERVEFPWKRWIEQLRSWIKKVRSKPKEEKK
jgi:predicted PurR-regulated permease PerM